MALKKAIATAILSGMIISFTPVVSAEIRTIEADGYYTMGDGIEENQAVAKERARDNAKRAAGEKASVFVESISEVQNFKLTKDIIRTISANILKVRSAKVNPEIDGNSVRYHCHIVVDVDTDNVTAELGKDKKELEDAVRRIKDQDAEIARLNEELESLKAKYQTASESERQIINQQVKRNEIQFNANQWYDRAIEKDLIADYKKAVEFYQRALEIEPNHAEWWLDIGDDYWVMNSHQKAIESYRKYLSLKPYDIEMWLKLGDFYYDLQDYDNTVDCYVKALKVDPNDGPLWCELAGIYEEMGNYLEALYAYDNAIYLEPKNADYVKMRDDLLNKSW